MKYLIITILVVIHLTSLGNLSSAAHAQAGDGYDMTWNTIDSGGALFATGGDYTLGGSIGQPDAGALAGSDGYTLSGGFWLGGVRIPVTPEYHIYLPVVMHNR